MVSLFIEYAWQLETYTILARGQDPPGPDMSRVLAMALTAVFLPAVLGFGAVGTVAGESNIIGVGIESNCGV